MVSLNYCTFRYLAIVSPLLLSEDSRPFSGSLFINPLGSQYIHHNYMYINLYPLRRTTRPKSSDRSALALLSSNAHSQ